MQLDPLYTAGDVAADFSQPQQGGRGAGSTAESSTTAHQSEYHFIDVMIPVRAGPSFIGVIDTVGDPSNC